MTSYEWIKVFVKTLDYCDVVISTCGLISRELYAAGDRDGNLYMVGSMGGASSFGLGVALINPELKVFVLDGDGSALMRLGNYATISDSYVQNLYCFILNNGCFASTGGQKTCKLPKFLEELDVSVVDVEVTEKKYPRPSISLIENYERFNRFILAQNLEFYRSRICI